MKKNILVGIAAMMYFAANTGAASGATNLSEKSEKTDETPKETGEENKPLEGIEGGKTEGGTVGEKPVPAPQKAFNDESEKFDLSIVVEMKKNAETKLEGDDLKKFIEEESKEFKAIGDTLKGVSEKSAHIWARWEPVVKMELTVEGKLNINKFLNSIWNMLSPDVKLAKEGKPNQFYSFGQSAKWGNSAAKVLETLRSYLRQSGNRIYSELLATVAKPEVVGEDLTQYKTVNRAIKVFQDSTILPHWKFVQLGEDNTPMEGAKPVELQDILKRFYEEAIKPHLEAPKSEKEKADAAKEEQIAEEISAEEMENRIKEMQEKLAAKKAAETK